MACWKGETAHLNYYVKTSREMTQNFFRCKSTQDIGSFHGKLLGLLKNNLHSFAQKHHIFNSNDKLEPQHCIKEHLKGTL